MLLVCCPVSVCAFAAGLQVRLCCLSGLLCLLFSVLLSLSPHFGAFFHVMPSLVAFAPLVCVSFLSLLFSVASLLCGPSFLWLASQVWLILFPVPSLCLLLHSCRSGCLPVEGGLLFWERQDLPCIYHPELKLHSSLCFTLGCCEAPLLCTPGSSHD